VTIIISLLKRALLHGGCSLVILNDVRDLFGGSWISQRTRLICPNLRWGTGNTM